MLIIYRFKLKGFSKFVNTVDALDNCLALTEGKVTPKLTQLLLDHQETASAALVVADAKLGSAINKLPGLKFDIVSDQTVNPIYRAIKEHLCSLVSGISEDDLAKMALGVAHSLSRHRLKFSPDKVDTMIVQAIGLLDDLDKELNTYSMRVKEWYGWHFPEMAKIISDSLAYARVVKAVGFRSSFKDTDLSDLLPEDLELAIKHAAEMSMGTDITELDLQNINLLNDQIISLTEYRSQLSTYLRNRMQAIAPNLTVLVGELIGARLIAHSGSLLNLAKQPASTIQILGAEKALFRALKTKHNTPKYGIIYHSSLIGQASPKFKGKIARTLATKLALCLRVDSLTESKDGEIGVGGAGEEGDITIGLENRAKVEARLRSLESEGGIRMISKAGRNGGGRKPSGKFDLEGRSSYQTTSDVVMQNGGSGTVPLITEVESSQIVEINGEAEETVHALG